MAPCSAALQAGCHPEPACSKQALQRIITVRSFYFQLIVMLNKYPGHNLIGLGFIVFVASKEIS